MNILPNRMKSEGYLTASECAKIAKVSRGCIYQAISLGKLKYFRVAGKVFIRPEDFSFYRENKYNPTFRKSRGELIWDKSKNEYSIREIVPYLCEVFNIPITYAMVYYYVKSGKLKSYRKGKAWVIKEEDIKTFVDCLIKDRDCDLFENRTG